MGSKITRSQMTFAQEILDTNEKIATRKKTVQDEQTLSFQRIQYEIYSQQEKPRERRIATSRYGKRT